MNQLCASAEHAKRAQSEGWMCGEAWGGGGEREAGGDASNGIISISQ